MKNGCSKANSTICQDQSTIKVQGSYTWDGRQEAVSQGLNKQKSSLSRHLTRTILIWGDGRNTAELLRNPGQGSQETYTFYRKHV